MMRTPLLTLAVALAGLALSGCGVSRNVQYAPYFDGRVTPKEGASSAFALDEKSVVLSDIDRRFVFHEMWTWRNASLGESGRIESGDKLVLQLRATDEGDSTISLGRFTDNDFVLCLQIEDDWVISAGYFGPQHGAVPLFGKPEGDRFLEGRVWPVYFSDDVVAGHFEATFEGNTLYGNFRTLSRRR